MRPGERGKGMFLTMLMLAAVSCATYHFLIKTLPNVKQPFASLAVAYLVATVVCALLAFLFEKNGGGFAAFQTVSLQSIFLGVALVGVEVAVFYLYRLGSELSVTPLLISIAQTLVIFVVSVLVLKEAITVRKVVGIAVSVAGIWLMTKK